MILGIGSDVVNIQRIEKILRAYEGRFLQRVLTEAERAYVTDASFQVKAERVAKRFAAKEALVKALGTGFSDGIFFQDIEIKRSKKGAPSIQLGGNAKKYLAKLTPNAMVSKINLSLSDDYPTAQAFVIISAVPNS